MPSNPTSFPYCLIFVAWLIELGKKMVIVRARVVSSQTRFSPTMTPYSTMILGYCRIQLKKKWQTCHQVPRCWPHSTVCWSPGHGIGRPGLMVTSHITDRISGTWATSLMLHNRRRRNFRFPHQVPRCWPHSTVCRSPGHGIWSTWANGDIPMYIWPDNWNTGRFLEPPFRSQEPFPLPETEVTSSKMAGGSGNGSWLLNGGSKNLPILLACRILSMWISQSSMRCDIQ